MRISQRHQFSIKCECIIIKNNIQINGKKKSKFSSIGLNNQKRLLTVQPYGSPKEQQILHFPIAKLKAIHKKYIEQGKITLQFTEKTQKVIVKEVDVASLDQVQEIITQILISSASKQNLDLLISKIVAIKGSQQNAKSITQTQAKKHIKKAPIDLIQIEEKSGLLNRKQLIRQAMIPQKQKIVTLEKKQEPRVNFFDLPSGIIDSVFEFCTLSLRMRVICKKFSQYILKNISCIKLKDEVDEKTFNRLCKWAVEVSCRMKNVKNIQLSDKFEQQELMKNRAKTLRFGNWKEVSIKNIMQLKGLRIFCLQLPYHIKFDLSNLFGVRMVELRLKSSQVTNNRCEFVKTQDLLYLIKTIKDLKVLELPFSNSDLLSGIENPKKMAEIKIYYLQDIGKDQSWRDLSKYQNLKIFSLWNVQRMGVKKDNHEIDMTFPGQLKELQVGCFLSESGLSKLPLNLEYLKLLGENYFNSHIQKMYLPNLKLLDITMSRNIRQDILEYVQDISLLTFWERNTIQYVSNYAKHRQIRLTTINPAFK